MNDKKRCEDCDDLISDDDFRKYDGQCEDCYYGPDDENDFEYECYGCKGGSNCCMSPHCP